MPPNGDNNSNERRRGMDEIVKVLQELKDQQKYINDAHLSCRAETQTELKFINESIQGVVLTQASLIDKINQVNVTLNGKINGVDKALSIKDQDLDGRIKSISTKQSAVVGTGAASGAVIIWEIVKFLWDKIKVFMT